MAVYRTSSWPHGSLFNLGHGIANCDGEFRCGNTRWDFSSCARMRGGPGRTRTDNQSVMEYRGVRPTPLVGHPSRSPEKSKGDLAEKGSGCPDNCPTRVLGRTRT